MEKNEALINELTQRGMTITRVFNAPRELVWLAWTDAEHLAKWWGPKGFTNPVCEWDPKVGNAISVHMKAPDGTIYPMDGVFHEITAQERIVFTSGALDNEGKRLFEIRNTVTFSEEDGKTRISMHLLVANVKAEGAPYLGGMNEGWNMSLDKLTELLKNM